MIEFRAYASNFELFPKEGEAFQCLSPLLGSLKKVDFILRIDNPSVNQGQMVSNLDDELKKVLLTRGAAYSDFQLPKEIPQEFDFAFEYGGRTVAVEIEKSNREKILRDILKCHIYLHAGVYYALVGLPRNYAHLRGMWDLYDFGVQRYKECINYGFGTPDKLSRILLLGFTQYDALTNEPFTKKLRQQMREKAAAQQNRR